MAFQRSPFLTVAHLQISRRREISEIPVPFPSPPHPEVGGDGRAGAREGGARTCGLRGGARAAVVRPFPWWSLLRLPRHSANKGLVFNVHPVLMLIGFIILGSEAIMSYKILPWSHDTNKMVHMLLHAIALFLGSVGIYAAFKFHNESGIANLYSLHSWIGLGTIFLYGIQWLLGVTTFFFPGASPTVRRRMLPWHVRSGLVVYILALLAAELGFLEKLTFLQANGLGRYSSEALLVNFTALLVVLLGASVVLFVTAPMHNEHTHGYSAVHKP